jgi:hypothetical protein
MSEEFVVLGISAFLVEKPSVPTEVYRVSPELLASVNSNNYFLPFPHHLAIPAHLFIMNCVVERSCRIVCTFNLCSGTDGFGFLPGG